MGLDMYAFAVDASKLPEQYRDSQYDVPSAVINAAGGDMNFAYWRKFNALHGWMARLYQSKGGRKEFNCTTVRLMPEDIARLEADAPTLQPVDGFFFGPQVIRDEDRERLADFISRAKDRLQAGYAIFYDSWW